MKKKNKKPNEIETKAGIKFFKDAASNSSNFAKQSFNSIKNVNKLENYKVFLNPRILSDLDNPAKFATYKNNVINAWKNWEGGALYELPGVKSKFETFANTKGYDLINNTIEDLSLIDNILQQKKQELQLLQLQYPFNLYYGYLALKPVGDNIQLCYNIIKLNFVELAFFGGQNMFLENISHTPIFTLQKHLTIGNYFRTNNVTEDE